jgi:alkylation response protein AidB-like acyl-CoA dehydrogenase
MTPALWSTLVDLGWTGLLVPEDQGGTGAGLLETCIVLEQMGRIPLPGPFFSSAVAATLAARALGATELLGDLASGASRGTVALGEQGHGEPLATVRTRARRKAAQWVLSGEKRLVVDGHTADWAIVVARSEEGVRSYLLEAPAGELVPSLDPTRKLARLVLDDAPAAPLGPPGNQAALWRRVQDDVAVALAAETVGAADRALAEAIAYTSERVVFDKPVATYQTVRHRLVEMFQQVEMARAGFQFAAWASDTEAPVRGQSAAMAASYAAEAGVRVTGDDIQLHGGVGFTWANDAHFLFKRVKQNELLFGGAGAQRHRLASLFIESA